MMVAPSGEQFTLNHGTWRAVVVEVGGGIRILSRDGQNVVQGYGEQAVCDSGRGQLLVPWPNRIEGASYRFGGVDHQLAVTEKATGCAIHGLTRWAIWRCVEDLDDQVTLTHRLHPQPGWNGIVDLSVTYQLDDDGLTVSLTATNVGPTSVPFGAGAHPYLLAGAGPVDEWILTVDADTYYATDPRGLPMVHHSVESTPFDFRDGRSIGDTVLDTPFTELHRDPDDRVWAHLRGPDGHLASIWADAQHKWFQVFTGDHLSDPDRRRSAVAIEPMTCPPNAFRSGEDLTVLNTGEEITLRWGIHAA